MIKKLRNKLEQRKGERKVVERKLHENTTLIKDLKREKRRHEKAKEIIRRVSLQTQNQLRYHINDITSLALEAIFADPYKLEIEFVTRRDKTECDIYFVDSTSEKINPTDASGGGAVDVAAFALRIASWAMQTPKPSAVMLLDEPFKFLSADMTDKASSMLKEVCDKLEIQFIIITHKTELAAWADQILTVTKSKKTKISKVQ